MLAGLDFGRCKRSGHTCSTAACDALFSRVRETGDRESLSIRLHEDVMRRLRWMLGDYVRLKPKDDSGNTWVVYRVAGPKDGGLKLTRSGRRPPITPPLGSPLQSLCLSRSSPQRIASSQRRCASWKATTRCSCGTD